MSAFAGIVALCWRNSVAFEMLKRERTIYYYTPLNTEIDMLTGPEETRSRREDRN